MKRSELMPARMRKGGGLTRGQKAAIGGALALMAAPAVRLLATNLRSRFLARRTHTPSKTEAQIDKTLKDTFPASDPPSSGFYDIPVNRQ